MKKIIAIILLTVMSALLLSGCVVIGFSDLEGIGTVSGTGTPQVFEFRVGEISEIRIHGSCNVEHYAAHSDTVTLKIQPNLMEYYTVVESGGVLTVESEPGVSFSNVNAPVLTVGSSALTHVSLFGAGNFTAHDTIIAEHFSFNLAGAGNGTIDVDVGSFGTNLSGAGDLTVSGRADTAGITLSGAGRVEALGLQTREANVNMAGAGAVRISSSEKLDITASGVGTVEYRGSPAVNIERSGVATVRQVD